MSIGTIQLLVFLATPALCVVALMKNKIVLSKLLVALGLTVIAGLQIAIIPIDARVEKLAKQVTGMDPENPSYPGIKLRHEQALAEQKDIYANPRRWYDRLPVNLGMDLRGGMEIRLKLSPDQSKIERLGKELRDTNDALIKLPPGPSPERKAAEDTIKRVKEDLLGAEAATKENISSAVDIIRERLNKSGLAEIPVTKQGANRVRIQLPGMDDGQAQWILDLIKKQGNLAFRLAVDETDDDAGSLLKKVRAMGWKEDKKNISPATLESIPPEFVTEDGRDRRNSEKLFDWLRTPEYKGKGGKVSGGEFHLVRKDILLTGEHIETASSEPDPRNQKFKVNMRFNRYGGAIFEKITGLNVGKKLAIVLDGSLHSAPNINGPIPRTSGTEITGNFDEREANGLVVVLRSGSIKVNVKEEYRNRVGSTLGEDSIRRGISAIMIGFVGVIVFMLLYYLIAGAVTDIVLLLNMLFLLAVLGHWGATLTLPGFAGLILTVGMAVDANVLIFERIREEREKGNSLDRSISLGYERAFVTIIDANVTTLISAIILHAFGTEAIRGFAITLIIGIITSMFCSIVVTRWFFDALCEYKLITEVKMLRLFGRTNINFAGLRRPALGFSLVCIAVGLGFVVKRGGDNLGQDFTGGVLTNIVIKQQMSMDEARAKAAGLKPEGFPDAAERIQSFGEGDTDGKFTKFVLRTTFVKSGTEKNESGKKVLKTRDEFKAAVRKVFPLVDEGRVINPTPLPERSTDTVKVYQVALSLSTPISPKDLQEILETQGRLVAPYVLRKGAPLPPLPSSDKVIIDVVIDGKDKDGKALDEKAQLAGIQSVFKDAKQELIDPATGIERIGAAASSIELGVGKIMISFKVTASRPVTSGEVTALLESIEALKGSSFKLQDLPPPPPVTDTEATSAITVLCGVKTRDNLGELLRPEAQVNSVSEQFSALRVQKKLDFTDPFPLFTEVGAVVASEMATNALMALIYAVAAIFFYIWLRFQFRASFGLGAILALVHDVLFVVGALAIIDELGVLNGQIDLTIVAALLTIVGYSLNDTIVIYDRIRENMHGGGKPLEEVVNLSVNQTLSRTVITSGTTMLVVIGLLVWGGDVIRGFAFALFVGIAVGTYSSIFIASPVLIEMAAMKAARQKKNKEQRGIQSS